MLKQLFFFDFETRSRGPSLKDVGAFKYALHPSTEASLLAYAIGIHSIVKVWDCLREPIPNELIDVMENPQNYDMVAWNVFFDMNIWRKVLPRMFPYINFKGVPLSSIHDAAALSLHFRTGASLETAAVMHRLPHGKSKAGEAVMRKQASPSKNGEYPELTFQELQDFKYYARTDVQIMREIYLSLPKLPETERYCFEWTLRRNLEGLRLDMKLVALLDQLVEHVSPPLEKEFTAITGYKMRSPKMIEWMKKFYPHINSLDAENMEDLYLDSTPVPSYVRRAIEIKYLIGSSSISKLKVALRRAEGGRIHEVLAYHKAQTKRWAGQGIQVQNFPRSEEKPSDPFDFEIDSPDLCEGILKQAFSKGFKEPVKFARNLLRRIFLPEEGEVLVAGDFSKIEPTVLFWLLDMGDIPPKWYEELAAAVFQKDLSEITKEGDERQIGKMGQLLSGYGGGWASFKTQVKKQVGMVISESLAKLTINTYRRKYPKVVEAWASLDNAFRAAIRGQGSSLFGGKIQFISSEYRSRRLVVIRLPSGGFLYYHNARIHERVDEKGKFKSDIIYDSDEGEGRVQAKKIYGGLICENVVSATAREVMRSSMWKLESKGFNILNLVHDEIWASINKERFDEFLATMAETPSWARGMTVKAEGSFGVRYLK